MSKPLIAISPTAPNPHPYPHQHQLRIHPSQPHPTPPHPALPAFPWTACDTFKAISGTGGGHSAHGDHGSRGLTSLTDPTSQLVVCIPADFNRSSAYPGSFELPLRVSASSTLPSSEIQTPITLPVKRIFNSPQTLLTT